MIRKPAVAGSFYPSEPAVLKQELEGYLACEQKPGRLTGLVVPHAGYVFSGAIAAIGYRSAVIPPTVVLVGPNHHGLGPQASLFASGQWQTPLGKVPVDAELGSQLLDACQLLESDELAHRFEHSLEVQLPFLQVLRPDLSIIPISLGHGELDDWLQLGHELGAALRRAGQPVLLVASTDMNHFASAEESRRVDLQAIAKMEAYDPAGLFALVREQEISMCGVIPAVVVLEAARVLGGASCRLLHYGHSGEINGDHSSVVGYATLAVN